MRIIIDFKRIGGLFQKKDAICVRCKIGETIIFTTDYVLLFKNYFTFLQRFHLNLECYSDCSFIEIAILDLQENSIAKITVFFKKFKQFNNIEITSSDLKDKYLLQYEVQQLSRGTDKLDCSTEGSQLQLQKVQQSQTETGKFQFLKMGTVLFHFIQKLDFFIYFCKVLADFIFWKNPIVTLTFGIIATITVYNLTLTILLTGILLFAFRQKIINKLSKVHKLRNSQNSIMVSQQNAYFLQKLMDEYCLLYENISNFLFSHDKTLIINAVKLICKMALLLITMLMIFQVQHLIVINIWSLLLLTSPLRQKILNKLIPVAHILLGQNGGIMSKISEGLINVLGNTGRTIEQDIYRQFYFYHYQYWWFFKWLDEAKKFSDQKYDSIILLKEEAPEGWAWGEDWKIDAGSNTDEEGYQYANWLKKQYTKDNVLAVWRRRKWKRACSRIRSKL